MELLNMFWLLYLDGYTGEHWSTIVWMLSINGGIFCAVVIAFFRRQDARRYPLR